jgi:[ribosomal protein S18]-alanine N-acetyltransferase
VTPEALARLHAAVFSVPRPWSAAEFAALLDGPGVFLLTADRGARASPPQGSDGPPGFLLGRALAGEAEVLTLAVAPDARRRGIGAGLVAAGLARAAEMGAAMVFLEVAADNAPALGLYRAAGFAEAGRRPGYYLRADGTRTDAILMRHGPLPGPA